MPENNTFIQKIGAGIRKAYTGKFRFIVIAMTAIIFLYAMYFGFCFKPTPSSGGKDAFWADARNIAFHVISGFILLGLFFYGMYCFARRTLTFRKAAVLIALMGGIYVSIYGLSTPIWDYGGLWNQHDLYYGSTASRYYMADRDITDCGGGHFGMIMTIYRYGILPEIKMVNGEYDFSFGAVLERYQPKLFYLISALFMRIHSLFVPENDAIVSLGGSAGTTFGLTNKEWSLYESLRLLYTMMEWLQIYFIYKIFVRLRFKGLPLLIAFALAIFNPMWCFFANWTNNDGMSAFFAIVGLYYAICYVQDGRTYQILMIAIGVGCSMACKLGGALIAIVIAPMLLYRFVKSISDSRKGIRTHRLPEWAYVTLQLFGFALLVFPLGLGFPVYNAIKFGQPIAFFSPVNNQALYIVNESFFERFLLFPNSDTFRMIWVYHSNQHAYHVQDTSLLTALVKTSLYGEYAFGQSPAQCAALYASALLLIGLMMVLLPYRLIRFFVADSHKVNNPLRFYVFAAIILVFYGWAVIFVNSYPHTCNEDMRYIPIVILALSGMVGSTFQSFEEKPLLPRFEGLGKGAMLILSASFAIVACVAYLTMSPWYYLK